MKKGLLILLIVFLLSGCTITRIDNYNYDGIIDKVLSLDIKTYNNVGKGYKYYAPHGVVRTDAKEYNDVLKNGVNTYYLYVDVVGYYYKTAISYPKHNNSYFYKKLNYNDKKGYINITEVNDKLYVQMVYNYAKIETYVDKSNLKDVIMDISYILSSTKFNNSLLKKMYESGNLTSKEETYKLFDNKEKQGNFIKWVEEFDKYDGSQNQGEEEEIAVEKKDDDKDTSSVQDDGA